MGKIFNTVVDFLTEDGWKYTILEDDCELLYFMNAPFVSGAEGGVHPQDPRLAVSWPLPISELSARDAGLPRVTPEFGGFER